MREVLDDFKSGYEEFAQNRDAFTPYARYLYGIVDVPDETCLTRMNRAFALASTAIDEPFLAKSKWKSSMSFEKHALAAKTSDLVSGVVVVGYLKGISQLAQLIGRTMMSRNKARELRDGSKAGGMLAIGYGDEN